MFRAGISAIHRGQTEAALSLGLPPVEVMRFVVLPQAIRIMLPPSSTMRVQLLKDTTLASSVAAPEIMFRARNLVMETYLSMQIYLLVACIYLAMSIPLSHLAARLQRSGAGLALNDPLRSGADREPARVGAADAWGGAADAAADRRELSPRDADRRDRALLARTSRFPTLRWIAILYIEVGRGTPALVILFIIYFGLPTALPQLEFDSFTAAVVGLGLQGGALLGEVFRAGIEAIERGQREASLSLGLTPRTDHDRCHRAAGDPHRAAAGRQLCDRAPQGHLDRLDHRGAGADAPRQGPRVVELHADASLRARRASSISR